MVIRGGKYPGRRGGIYRSRVYARVTARDGPTDAQTFSGSFYCLPETTGRISVTSVDGCVGGFVLGRCAIVLLGAGVPVASLARHTVLGLARTGAVK